jgi:hypothetical protein
MNRKQRIQTVRTMADRIRRVCDIRSIYCFRDMEALIRKQERHHRKGYGSGGYRCSVAVAVDYFIVRCFSSAFQTIDNAVTADDMVKGIAGVRTDYLMALAIVARYRDELTASIHLGDLHEAADIIDYSDDIARR